MQENNSVTVHEILLRLLPLASSMAGFCIAALSFFAWHEKSVQVNTIADDILAFDALLFLLTSYVCLWALRTKVPRRGEILAVWVDGMFFLAMTALVAVGFLIVYSIF